MKEKYANQIGYTDITPFEIIKQNTPNKLTIRSMITGKEPDWKLKFVEGGFCGICVNQNDLRWTIKSNPNGVVNTIRKNKKGEWRDRYKSKYTLSEKPVKFYDYNF